MQDGLIEWNTLFLIARRQFPRYYQQLNWLCELGWAELGLDWAWLARQPDAQLCALRFQCSPADWATFYPMRLVLFPVLLPFFWREMTVSSMRGSRLGGGSLGT